MKNLFLLIAFFAFSAQAFAQDNADTESQTLEVVESVTAVTSDLDTTSINEEIVETNASQLTVVIKGLDSDKGTLMIGLYDSKGTWLSKVAFSDKSAIVDGAATVVFENVPAGIYAISTYHDENDNKKLDSGIFGIPKEPYAASRGAKGRFGPPKWKDAKFEITGDTHTEEIKY